jgi:hypothetical protein
MAPTATAPPSSPAPSLTSRFASATDARSYTASTYSARPATAPAAPPSKPAAPPSKPAARDEASARLDKQAAAAAPGAHRVGDVYKGSAPEEGGRSDWYVDLPANRCYLFVGEGGDGVKGLYLYLWGPNGKRVTDKRGREEAHPQMPYCTTAAGKYHFQVKISDGAGEYRLGIYQR